MNPGWTLELGVICVESGVGRLYTAFHGPCSLLERPSFIFPCPRFQIKLRQPNENRIFFSKFI